MISNSVTHLRSYTKFTIAGNSMLISPWTWRAPMLPCQAPMSLHRAPISSHRMKSVQVFCEVSHCFKSVSWCFTSGSWCWCFTTYHNVLWCLVSHATIGIADRRLPQGSAITRQKLAMTPQGSSRSPRKWSLLPCESDLLWSPKETGVTLFLENNFRRGSVDNLEF